MRLKKIADQPAFGIVETGRVGLGERAILLSYPLLSAQPVLRRKP
jgi:hypothetical protein